MIELRGASRWYGQVLGLNDVTCAVGPGLTALLGPNGAGKSTLLRLVTGQLRPTTGSVTVFGERPFANPRVLRRLGYCPEVESLYEEMTGREFVTLLAALGGVGGAKRAAAVERAIERVGMTAHADRRLAGYSKGMRQRIKLAQAIAHDPQLLVLDEPLNGLDPLGRRQVAALLTEMAAAGACVILSSHILHEVEQLTQRLLLIHRGRLLAQGDIYEIRALIDRHPHRIAIDSPQARALGRRLMELPFVLSLRVTDRDDTLIEIETREPELFYNTLPEIALDEGFLIRGFDSPDNNLEAVFRYLVEP